jgi:HAD superfamily hydrolase (TIGR01490 family)
MAAGIAFFDVDHTLTRRSSGGRFVVQAMRRGILPLHLAVVVPWYSLMYRLGFFRLRVYAEGFPHLRGLSRARLEEIARESFDHRLQGDLFPRAVGLVRQLQATGERLVLATSSLDFIVAPLAEHLGVREVLATALEFRDGICTGHFAGTPMFRREKKERVLAFLAGEKIPPSACSFYSDSIFDLPLLEAVGTPVAMNPDIRLRRIARERGWAIIDVD